MKVSGTNALADNVPLRSRRNELHLLSFHDVFQLLSHLSHFAHGFRVDEVLLTPTRRVLVLLPLLVTVQQRQVVTLGYLELLSRLVSILLATFRPEEDGGDGQHRDNNLKIAKYTHDRLVNS